MSDTQLNIGQRMLAVCRAYGYAQKTKSVDTYKAISYDVLIGGVRQHMIDAGILVIPVLIDGQTVDSGKKTSKGGPIVRFEGVYDVHFTNCDDTNDRVTVRVPAHGEDYGDKAPGKATTYAVKAAIVKAYQIESGEDEESRVQGFARALTAAERGAIISEMDAAVTRADLRGLARAALAQANEAGDEVAYEMFKDAAAKLAAKLPDDGGDAAKPSAKPADKPSVALPVAKADVAPPDPGAQERKPEQNQDADPPPVGEAAPASTEPEKAKRGPPASPAMVAVLTKIVAGRKKMTSGILSTYGVKSFDELDRDEVKSAIVRVNDLTKPKE